MSGYRRSRGLTLLEVIVAMTVLAIGIAGVLSALSACLRSSEAAASYSRGVLLAQQVAAELARSETLEPGDLSGTFDEITDKYTWTADIEDPDAHGLYPVHIRVLWRNGRRHYELRTALRPRPLPEPATPATPASPQGPATPQGPGGQEQP